MSIQKKVAWFLVLVLIVVFGTSMFVSTQQTAGLLKHPSTWAQPHPRRIGFLSFYRSSKLATILKSMAEIAKRQSQTITQG